VIDLDAQAQVLVRLAAAVTDDQLDGPTPCTEITVGGLLGHLLGVSVAFRDAASKVEGPTTGTPPGPAGLPPDWRDQLPSRLAEMAAAWKAPEAWDGESTVGGVTSPAPQTAAFGNDELVVHGWDLAVSTGQSYQPVAENLQACWELVSNFPDDPQLRAGLFGPRVPIPNDAPLLDRTLAYAGRDPHWTPGVA
jgi:uncharacterized protein (TIGR03086 family)